MEALAMESQYSRRSRSRDDAMEIANVVRMPRLDDEGRDNLVDGREGVCLNGMHVMAKLFPGTIGRVVR